MGGRETELCLVALLVLGHKGTEAAQLPALAVVVERHLEPLALGSAILEPELHILALQPWKLLTAKAHRAETEKNNEIAVELLELLGALVAQLTDRAWYSDPRCI